MPTLSIYYGRDQGSQQDAANDARANQADFMIYRQRLFYIGAIKPQGVAHAEVAAGRAEIGGSLLDILKVRGADL